MFKKINGKVLSLRTNWTSDLFGSPLYTDDIIIQNKEYTAGKIFLIQSFIMVYQKTRVSSTSNTHAFIRMGSTEFKNTSWINRILDIYESQHLFIIFIPVSGRKIFQYFQRLDSISKSAVDEGWDRVALVNQIRVYRMGLKVCFSHYKMKPSKGGLLSFLVY